MTAGSGTIRSTPLTVTHNDDGRIAPLHTMSLFRRWAMALLGITCVGIGTVGAFLPGLPTTPFLLLASWCFSKSSRRLDRMLRNSRVLGPFLQDWKQHRAVRVPVRNFACTVILITVATTMLFSGISMLLKMIVLAAALIGLLVVLRLPTIADASSESSSLTQVRA